MKRIAALALAVVSMSVGALEVEKGDIRLILHEESARHTVYLRHDGDWVPLFLAEDPRTSTLEILEDNRIHRMGDSGTFAQLAEQTPEGARFVWTSASLSIVQDFRFTRGLDAREFNALEITVSVTNEGEDPSLVGVRFIYDTYLGERSNVHFITPGAPSISRETLLDPGPVNRYVASVTAPDAGYGFQIMLDGAPADEPEAAIVANWKRLIDSTWDYEVNESRNFNRLPYSINDSAVLVVYPTVQLAPGAAYSVTSYLGDLAPEGYASPGVARDTTGNETLLARLNELIARIDTLISADVIDPTEVEALQNEIETLASMVRGR
jgi:hypothetical protein